MNFITGYSALNLKQNLRRIILDCQLSIFNFCFPFKRIWEIHIITSWSFIRSRNIWHPSVKMIELINTISKNINISNKTVLHHCNVLLTIHLLHISKSLSILFYIYMYANVFQNVISCVLLGLSGIWIIFFTN